MKRWLTGSALALITLLAWLLLAPVQLQPAVWTPAPVKRWPKALVSNALVRAQWLAVGTGRGPEGIAVAPAASPDGGSVYAGYADGRIVHLSADGTHVQALTNTGGRPFGLAVSSDDRVWIADGVKGLMRVERNGRLSVVSDSAAGVRFGFTDDVAVAAGGGPVYFSDASSRFRYPDFVDDILEHGAHGRLLRYDPSSGHSDVLMAGIHFANGVALGPDDAYVLVSETSSYRILRYWLKGPKAGTHDVFASGLPGFPDNLSFNGGDRVWVAIYAPRDAQLDALAAHPWLRKLVARLPAALQPKPRHVGRVLCFDLDGHEIADLRDDRRQAYAPITSVEEYGPWLWLGSKDENAIARIPLNAVFADVPAPPANWQRAPAKPVPLPPAS